MPSETMSLLLRCVLAMPVAAAAAIAVLGPHQRELIRKIALAATLLVLVLSGVLAVEVASQRSNEGTSAGSTFAPIARTSWDLMRFGDAEDAPAVRFDIGLDGLNVWLVALTSLLMFSAVLVSWNVITERVNEYYAWLLALQTVMTGVFLSFDILLFYVFFELTLVPLFFLIGIWGGPQRQRAASKFFIYTLTGSVFTMLGVLGIVVAVKQAGGLLTFSIPTLLQEVGKIADGPGKESFRTVQVLAFLAMTAGFAIKVPLVPVHTWLPHAHVEAPTAGSVILAGVLLKLGTYGFLRLCLPLTPDAAVAIGPPLLGTLAVIGIVYGAFCALAQEDIKKLVAYSSVSHLGYCVLGLFALNAAGIGGSLLQMVNHGLSTGALFLLVGMLYERYHTRKISDYGGMARRLKLLAVFMVIACLSSAGLPGLNGFVGEALVLAGAFDMRDVHMHGPTLAAVAATGVVLGAWYLFTLLRRVFFGALKEPTLHVHGPVRDLDVRELAALVPVVAMFVVIGVFPQLFLKTAEADIKVVTRTIDDARRRQEEAAGRPVAQETKP
jgi:NADH-quinone oxidoreductase subunit M